MMYISQISTQGFYLSSREIQPYESIPFGWIIAPPPEGEGDFKWFAGQWFEIEGFDATPRTAQPKPIQISRIDFARLFTGVQQAKINALRKICTALTLEDYSDPTKGLFIQLEIVFQQFDMPLEFIELNHDDTRLGLELLAYAGVFGEDTTLADTEVERIIQGNPPE